MSRSRMLTAAAVAAVLGLGTSACGLEDSTPQAAPGERPARVTGTGTPASTRDAGGPAAGPTVRGSGVAGGASADRDRFFTPRRLAPGQRPPQFVIVSFDGAGSHAKWQYWQQVTQLAGARVTAFLSGVYLLDGAARATYHGPGHPPGRNSLGYWFSPADVRTLIGDLNAAWSRGEEIGTHYNGHFCAGDPPGGGTWTTAQWNSELDQFFRFWRDFRSIDGIPDAPELAAPAASVLGGRTPCLENQPAQLTPALLAHGLRYDSSAISNGIAWPRQDASGLWEFPLAYVPLAGRAQHAGVVSMDYNFWVKQTGNPPSMRHPTADADQVLRTYQSMYRATVNGNRAPLVLGNHFNDWNGGAYTSALSTFLHQTCRKPDTYCVPYRDVLRWMAVQDPAILARLQAQPAVDEVGQAPHGMLRAAVAGPTDDDSAPAAGADETGAHHCLPG